MEVKRDVFAITPASTAFHRLCDIVQSDREVAAGGKWVDTGQMRTRWKVGTTRYNYWIPRYRWEYRR